MIELYLSKNKIEGSAAYGKYYPRVSYKQTLNIHDMARHIEKYNKNTPIKNIICTFAAEKLNN